MKTTCSLLFLLISLFASISRGTDNTSQKAYHVGSTYYPLGTKDNPVTANEYCAFLNSNDEAHAFAYTCTRGANCFMCPSFMNENHIGAATLNLNGHTTLYKDTCITRYNEYHYRYTVVPGKGNYIIDGLPPSNLFNLIDVINEFDNWRRNPTSEEICNYLNHHKTNDSEVAQFHDYYLSASSLKSINLVAFEADSNDPSFLIQEQFSDERNRPIFTFSADKANPSAVIATPIPGMEYYRPSVIKISLK